MFKIPKRGPYTGRLAFDPDAGFHVDPDGRRLITLDEGATWRYAKRGDASHQHRYQKRVLVVDATANQTEPEPHHYEVQPGDAHYHLVGTDPDHVAESITSHTEAYRG